jgi:AdoMet-dependent rRNA methyltransferase SPB1
LADLKVLGKGDFKVLMKWRLALRLELGLDVKAEAEKDVTEDVTIEPMDEEEEITEEVCLVQEMASYTNACTAQEAARGKNG